jgi:hypothetical protein
LGTAPYFQKIREEDCHETAEHNQKESKQDKAEQSNMPAENYGGGFRQELLFIDSFMTGSSP